MNFLFQGEYYNYEKIQKYKKLNLFRFNYLNNFITLLGKKQITNDIGWSCTIKSFQMLVAIILAKFNQKKNIINLLYLETGKLSIHNFITYLNKKKYKEGVYLGSFLISSIYSTIIQQNQKLLKFNIHLTQDNIIDINQLNLHSKNVLLFSTRLGLHKLNKQYYQLIYNCFQSKHFLGFIGGISQSCYYFYAYDIKTNYLLYLDPHVVTNYDSKITCNHLIAKNHSIAYIKNLNPSITFCFYYQNYQSFMELKKFLESKTIFNILHKIDYSKKIIDSKNKKNTKDNNNWEII